MNPADQIFEAQEVAIVISVKNQNPAVLSVDFLKYSGIVPDDWQPTKAPIISNNMSQVSFQSGVSLIAEVDKVIFAEAIGAKDTSQVKVAQIARKYIETLPNIDYLTVSINPRGHVVCENGTDAASNYLVGTLLYPGDWQKFGIAPVRTAIQFTYTLERCKMNLTLNEAGLRLSETKNVPIVLFSGNFNYDLAGNTLVSRRANLLQVIENWQVDLKTYIEIVNAILVKQ